VFWFSAAVAAYKDVEALFRRYEAEAVWFVSEGSNPS
jgi:hypothetical protein